MFWSNHTTGDIDVPKLSTWLWYSPTTLLFKRPLKIVTQQKHKPRFRENDIRGRSWPSAAASSSSVSATPDHWPWRTPRDNSVAGYASRGGSKQSSPRCCWRQILGLFAGRVLACSRGGGGGRCRERRCHVDKVGPRHAAIAVLMGREHARDCWRWARAEVSFRVQWGGGGLVQEARGPWVVEIEVKPRR